eukprot:3750282-Alexandrium_andersonii.AAC.1
MTEAERRRRRIRCLLEKIEKAVQDEGSKLDSNQLAKKDCEEDGASVQGVQRDSECSCNIWDELNWQGDQLEHSSM